MHSERRQLWLALPAKFNSCYEWAMNSLKFQITALLCAFIVLFGNGCEKKSAAEKLRDDSADAVKKAGDSVKDVATKAKDAVKDTAQKAMDAGKDGVQQASNWATNAAAKTKEGAQKVESAVTNVVNDIKQKVQ